MVLCYSHGVATSVLEDIPSSVCTSLYVTISATLDTRMQICT